MRKLGLSIVFFAAVSFAVAAQSQDIGVTVVQSSGEGTVYGVPTHVDFWIHREIEADTLEAATTKAQRLEAELTVALAEAGTPHASLDCSAPAVTDIEKNWAVASARVRFTISRFGDAEKTATEFGALCDKVRVAAEKVEGMLRGPVLDTTQRDVLMKEAVKLATENAYPAAEAAAEVLKSEFYSVDSMRIESIKWNETPGTERAEPNLGQVACTVRVSVSYAVTPKQ